MSIKGSSENLSVYVKSLEPDLATKTLIDGKKVVTQTIEAMVGEGSIAPNTLSFGKDRRLACTLLHENYLQTYREQGIIFQTQSRPDYIAPFDLILLAKSEDIEAEYWKISDRLEQYYNYALIEGYEQFQFHDPEAMFEVIPSPEVAWKRANEFRIAHGFAALSESKRRLVAYNEAIFHEKISIVPVALYGEEYFSEGITQRAAKLGLRAFPTAELFYKEFLRENRESEEELVESAGLRR